MTNKQKFIHPYIPNSVPEIQEAMLKEIGANSIDDFYQSIPDSLQFKGKLDLPEAKVSELELRNHVEKILNKNKSCAETISFLGGGCYNHYVPAICDEVNGRSEFLTAYAGEPFEDHGRYQTLFEYQSMMGELLDMDVVNVPTYDWGQAASTSLRMAGRITGFKKVLLLGAINPDRLLIINNYCQNSLEIDFVHFDIASGKINLAELKEKLTNEVAAVYFENPSYFGYIEDQGQQIADLAHENGTLLVVGTDPTALGILTPPSQYGADIVCGDIQGLGMHMQYGGGQAGFIAVHDDEKFVRQYPSRLFGIESTSEPGEWGFGDVTFDRTSFADRDNCNEFIGTATALWGITAGVYLALMGPEGMKELGELIIHKTHYAIQKISEIKGVEIAFNNNCAFKEFVVNFENTGLTVTEINQKLLEANVFGGFDISKDFSNLKNCALYCVTEVITVEDIDLLVKTLDQIINH
jgi:glycine dehydrogenase subunit 1